MSWALATRLFATLLTLTCAAFGARAAEPRWPLLGEISSPLSSATATPPESAFHDWATSEAEAARIAAAWESEAVGLPWTRLQLERYIKHKMMPTRGARGLALVHVAMHDAWLRAREQDLDGHLALSMAAARVLAYLFPAEERGFDRIVFSLAAMRTGATREAIDTDTRKAISLGAAVGEQAVARAETDGAQYGWNGLRLQWYGEGRVYGPGTWEPTPPYFYFPPDEPFAPGWTPWALERSDQFRPQPPAFGSERYLRDLREVLEISSSLSDEQLRVAKFWVDGHGTVTPAGHWNQIAIDEVLAAKLDDDLTVALFAHLNMALADAFIAAWDSKYHYWTVRPVTAARQVLGVDFAPPILTPPFPSYVSGHATFSGAASEVLAHYFPARADALRAMADEAAHSRLLGGIHFRHDNDDGLALGRRVAVHVLQSSNSRSDVAAATSPSRNELEP